MARQYTREEVVARLRKEVEAGGPIYTVGAGTGISAKFSEAGGADLITTYPIARFRMMGHSSLAGYLPLCDSNATTLEMGEREILPALKEVPVAAGLLGPIPRGIWDGCSIGSAKLVSPVMTGPVGPTP